MRIGAGPGEPLPQPKGPRPPILGPLPEDAPHLHKHAGPLLPQLPACPAQQVEAAHLLPEPQLPGQEQVAPQVVRHQHLHPQPLQQGGKGPPEGLGVPFVHLQDGQGQPLLHLHRHHQPPPLAPEPRPEAVSF
jgi:hypothetical protein